MAGAKFNSRQRLDVYRGIFLLNRSFHSIVEGLDGLAPMFSPQALRDLRGMAQEVQLEINALLLDRLHATEERDWAEFGKVRTALEKRLKTRR